MLELVVFDVDGLMLDTESVWKEAIKNCVPEKFLELNLKAFDLGKNI